MGLRQIVKPVARTVLHQMGGLAMLRHRNRRACRILMYHRFPEGAEIRRSFEAQCAAFRKNYHPVSLTQIAQSIESGEPLPEKALAITIDDGYHDFLERGFPVFQAHDLPVTIFVVSDFLDRRAWLWTDLVSYAVSRSKKQSFELRSTTFQLDGDAARRTAARKVIESAKKLPNVERLELIARLPKLLDIEIPKDPPAGMDPLTWDEVRSLAKQGVDFGAHTKSHPILSRIPTADGQLYEIGESKRRLEEELSAPVRHFCYPNGEPADFNQTSVDCLTQTGFATAVTTTKGFNGPDENPFLLKRFGMEPASPLHFAIERAEGLH